MYTNVQSNKIPKYNEYFACLPVILLDSILANSDKKHLQIFFNRM